MGSGRLGDRQPADVGARGHGRKVERNCPAIPKLLELLELKGCIVTALTRGRMPAGDRRTGGADKGADYVLGLKGNQGSMQEAVEDYFATAEAAGFKDVDYEYAEEIDKGHGRLETRHYRTSADLRTLPNTERWKGQRNRHGRAGMPGKWQTERGTALFPEFHPGRSQAVRRCGARPLGYRKRPALEGLLKETVCHWRLDGQLSTRT
ncbi:MAG: ISAs1 family transposase [Methylococcales bacterium]